MTSNELDTIQADLVPDPSDRALDRIEKQARAMQAAHQLGTALAGTKMVPEIYQGKPDDATAAILYGAELGLTAVQSLQNVFIVRGKPAVYSRTMTAQVIAAGHLVEEVEASPESVTWRGVRADTGAVFESTWTIDRAKQAGFTSNKLYQSMPIEMLRAKAQAEVCRSMAPDVLLGMAHSVEDLQATPIERVQSRRVPSKPAGRDAARAALGMTTEQQPDEPEPEPQDEPADTATPAQLKRLHTVLTNAGISDAEERKAFLEQRAGRALASSKELTAAEVDQIIDFVENGEPA